MEHLYQLLDLHPHLQAHWLRLKKQLNCIRKQRQTILVITVILYVFILNTCNIYIQSVPNNKICSGNGYLITTMDTTTNVLFWWVCVPQSCIIAICFPSCRSRFSVLPGLSTRCPQSAPNLQSACLSTAATQLCI